MASPELFPLLDRLFDRLFPLMRSITGDGIETSMRMVGEYMPLSYFGVNSGTKVFDWEVPPTWVCKEAVLTGPDGRVVADMARSNLEVINYSDRVDAKVSLEELQSHLFSLPDFPKVTPYVTSYYRRQWGFCLPDSVRKSLTKGEYHARIDSHFVPGQVPLAHTLLPGECEQEIMLSSYLCHPSLANNELSGPLVLLGLYLRLAAWKRRRYTYRFVLNPETIGSVCYLHLHGEHLKKHMVAGLVLTCLGGPRPHLSYKTSRRGNAQIDRLARRWSGGKRAQLAIREFTPCSGSDERQFCSPGFNLPVGQMARTVYGEYDGYHNSLDTKEFMRIDALVESIDTLEAFLFDLDQAGPYLNTAPYGEPQLGKRDLYPNINSAATWHASSDTVFDARTILDRLLMTLSYSDGTHDLMDIADKCGCSLADLYPVVQKLEAGGLLKFCGSGVVV